MDQGWSIIQFDFLSEIADVDVEEIVVSIECLSLHPTHDLLTFENPSGTTRQEIQQVILFHR